MLSSKRMIVQIDSLYRDYNKYPYNSSFEITVNAQPNKNDVRNTNITNHYIQYAFSWIGNSQDNNPYSKIPKDTFQCKVIPIRGNQCIVIPPSEEVKLIMETIHYFNGLLVYSQESGKHATILNYESKQFLITLNQSIFENYETSLEYLDCHEDLNQFTKKMEDLYIINTSYHEKNNLNLLGVTQVEYQPNEKFIISKGAYRSLIVENVTKNWKRPIEYIRGIFRHVLLENLPSYDSTDYFIVYESPVLRRYVSTTPSFHQGVKTFETPSLENIRPGTYSDGNVRVVVHENSKEVIMEHPGNRVSVGPLNLQEENGANTLTIQVKNTGNGFVSASTLDRFSPNMLLAVINRGRNKIQYYTIDEIQKHIVYIFYETNDLQEIDSMLPIYLYTVPFEQIFPNLVVPMVPYNNLVCVEAKLISLTLPNLPVCGYNIYLADIPYVLVNFCNAQGNGVEVLGNIYSNIPAVTNHNFICPIANIRNPRLNFVILSCKEKTIFKFSPRDSLRFQVSLPSGERLSYVSNRYQNIFACPPLNIPLNRNRSENETKIFPFILNFGISAVFEMKIL